MIHVYAPTGEAPPPKYDSLVAKWRRESKETKRALEMLRTCLTGEQWHAFDRHGAFITENGEWMIVAYPLTVDLGAYAHSFNSYDLRNRNRYCVYVQGGGLSYPRPTTPGWPDHLIAQKMAVENDPDHYRVYFPHQRYGGSKVDDLVAKVRRAQGIKQGKTFDLGRATADEKQKIIDGQQDIERLLFRAERNRARDLLGLQDAPEPVQENLREVLIEYLNRNIVHVVDPAPLNVDGMRYLNQHQHFPEGDRVVRVEYDERNQVKYTRVYDHLGRLIEQRVEPY